MVRNNEAKLKADLIVAEAMQKPDREGYPKLTEEHPFFGRLRYFMADKSHWLGTATDLLNAMNDTATPPNTVTKLLNKFSIDLYFSDGIDVHFRRTNRKRIIELYRYRRNDKREQPDRFFYSSRMNDKS